MMSFLKAIEEKGGVVYEVGGTLRDAILNLPQKDKDLLVTHLPMEELVVLLSRYGTVQKVGKMFGVLKFKPKHSRTEFDIALPRQERSTGIGHRDFKVEFDHTIPVEKDLERRDFTINAMARDLKTGALIDPFGGQRDLQNKTLRQVFPRAFEEDPLRMLRAIQFSARFDLTIEPQTFEAMRQQAHLIQTVSPERVAEEIRKLFTAPKPSQGFQIMRESGILNFIFSDIEKVFEKTILALDATHHSPHLFHSGDLELMLATLFHLTSQKTFSKWAKAYPVSMWGIEAHHVNILIQEYLFKIEPLDHGQTIRRWVSQIGKSLIFKLIDLRIVTHPHELEATLSLRKKVQQELSKNPPLDIKDLAIDGHDLMKMGFPEGVILGRILRELLEIVLEEPKKNTREVLTNEVEKRYKTQMTN